jgi:hypothetical protein
MKDALWQRVEVEAQRLAGGHYTWCEDHQDGDDEYGGYCYRSQTTPFGQMDMGNGSEDGRIMISVDVGDQSLTELSVSTASCIAAHLEIQTKLAYWAGPMDR